MARLKFTIFLMVPVLSATNIVLTEGGVSWGAGSQQHSLAVTAPGFSLYLQGGYVWEQPYCMICSPGWPTNHALFEQFYTVDPNEQGAGSLVYNGFDGTAAATVYIEVQDFTTFQIPTWTAEQPPPDTFQLQKQFLVGGTVHECSLGQHINPYEWSCGEGITLSGSGTVTYTFDRLPSGPPNAVGPQPQYSLESATFVVHNPEPATWLGMACGLAAIAAMVRRRGRSQ